MATILISGDRHLANFNKSRYSRHKLLFPNRLSLIGRLNLLQGISLWNPVKYNCDLIHSFNEVPITKKLWIGTFESYIPRTIGKYDSYRKKQVRKLILQENCAKLISLSESGCKQAEYWNRDWSMVSKMMNKIEVIHPAVTIKNQIPKRHNGHHIRLIFY
jgi:hypothetical protein